MVALRPSSMSKDSSSCVTLSLPHNSFMGLPRVGNTRICGFPKKNAKIYHTHLRILVPIMRNTPLRLEASRESLGLTQEQNIDKANVEEEKLDKGLDLFDEMKHRFLTFKRHRYLENLDHYQSLARAQAPKFMVIACADSRVCPSYILGFQPGEAFVVRNVGNLVPPFENGPTETNAALEFSVNTLEVENILVIGHSCCGGIQALMSMEDGVQSSSFIRNWVIVGKDARLRTKAIAANLSFDQQCRHCEKFYQMTLITDPLLSSVAVESKKIEKAKVNEEKVYSSSLGSSDAIDFGIGHEFGQFLHLNSRRVRTPGYSDKKEPLVTEVNYIDFHRNLSTGCWNLPCPEACYTTFTEHHPKYSLYLIEIVICQTS
ncbi:Carbonic anhydrase [Macleaya cordata]|uniref:carbonic anhydrase n=1 Tax=Macleaya cordata TaxID=56857 RepID=A0A200PU90_MACCD|nr:Carbonic anhydrase [Macleaya cordata]